MRKLKKNFLLSEKGWNTWLQDSLRTQHKEDLTIELNSLWAAELRSPTFPWTLARHFLLFHHHNSNSLQPFCVPYHYTAHFPTNPPQLVRIGTLVSRSKGADLPQEPHLLTLFLYNGAWTGTNLSKTVEKVTAGCCCCGARKKRANQPLPFHHLVHLWHSTWLVVFPALAGTCWDPSTSVKMWLILVNVEQWIVETEGQIK